MPTTYYHTVNGQITGQTASGTRTHFLTDALGSVTGMTDDSGAVLNTYRYRPYGGALAKSGVAADPRLLWIGSLGYRAAASATLPTYVRARHLYHALGSWSTIDPLRRYLEPYSYVAGSPTGYVDPMGLDRIYVQLCAFIGDWRAAKGKEPYIRMLPPFAYWGYNTNERTFNQDPLRCKIFAEVTISSCLIGKTPPSLSPVKTGESKIVIWNTLAVVHRGHPAPTVNILYQGAKGCLSKLWFKASASISLPWKGWPQAPPIVIEGTLFFVAGKDKVTVFGNVKRTAFPDFEYRIGFPANSWMQGHESPYSNPETGLLAPPVTDKIFKSGDAITSCDCGGSCP